MKPILAVMIGWRLMIDVPALTRRSFYRPLLRTCDCMLPTARWNMAFSSCRLRHRHDHRTGGGGRQLAVGLHLRGDLLRFDQQRFHNLSSGTV